MAGIIERLNGHRWVQFNDGDSNRDFLRETRKSPESVQAKCGWGGIRTPGSLSTTAVFKTAALNHSATHPIARFVLGAWQR